MRVLLIFIWLLLSTAAGTCHRRLHEKDEERSNAGTGKAAIVFVYTMSPAVCGSTADDRWNHFPLYIQQTLQQALFSQQPTYQHQHHIPATSHGDGSGDTMDVVFISNYKECSAIKTHIIDPVQEFYDTLRSAHPNPNPNTGRNVSSVLFDFVDTSDIQSPRTAHFINSSGTNIFMPTHGDLWVAAAARFFWLEDAMRVRGFTELIHVEADNLLYAPMAPLLPSLRKHYPNGLAVTPMEANKSGFTASFLWVASLPALIEFTNYFTELASGKHDTWTGYLAWLRRWACCKTGSGIAEDANGRGIKPYKINEMTVLAYYHYVKEPGKLYLLPVVPPFKYHTNRYTCNMSHYAPNGEMTGASLYVLDPKALDSTVTVPVPASNLREALPTQQPTGNAVPDAFGSIFDPGSWGQYLGGTNAHSGRNKKFTDSSHIVGQAVTINNCVAAMRCGNVRGIHYMQPLSSETATSPNTADAKLQCFLAPFVQCGDKSDPAGLTRWYPLIQLHVHAKKTEDFVSYGKECNCIRE